MNEMNHFGILGMRWGRRKRPSVSKETFDKRVKVINKMNRINRGKLSIISITEGRKHADRILDIMAENPKKNFRSAKAQQEGEQYAKRILELIMMRMNK